MAGTLIGGAFLSAFLQMLFDRMASRSVLDFVHRSKLDDSLLKKLKINLITVDKVVSYAEEKQFSSSAVRGWLRELKAAVYSAEDLLDEIVTESSRFHTNQVRKIFSAPFRDFEKRMNLKMKDIVESLEYLIKQKDALGLREETGERSYDRSSVRSVMTTSLVDRSGVCGRDSDKEGMIGLALSNDENGDKVSVIAIVGMGGIGKTTLAQLVYNDSRVGENFDFKSWVCVSEDFDVFRVTKTVLDAVTSLPIDTDDLNLLHVRLAESLMGKKFLLVLDDVWCENYDQWEVLCSPLLYGAAGSKIIVTTRNESVALSIHARYSYHLGLLSDEDCWLLFEKQAFGNGDSSVHYELVKIGREITRKCKGLSLAAEALGGLLRCKRDVATWNHVLRSDIWDLPNDRSNILPALRLSYHYLPSHLKRCFVDCALFPKDYEFEVEKLVLLWMGEGLLPCLGGNKKMEDAGVEYFEELRLRSFFQQQSGNHSRFIMHDLLNDLAKFVSGDLCFSLEGEHESASCKVAERVSHFSYVRTGYDYTEKFETFCQSKQLRTFLPLKSELGMQYLDKDVYFHLLPQLRCLRVLSLANYGNIKELPSSIGNLKHLRYLDLSCTAIERLPESICDLYNLQTLLLADCHSLTLLPSNIGELINLIYLDIRGTKLKEMPLHISRLKNLQILPLFCLGCKSGSSIREMGELRHLKGSLSVVNLENVVCARDAWEAKLNDKEKLNELVLKWGNTDHTGDTKMERDVLEMLRPHEKLEKLSIEHYGGTRLADWVGDPSFSNTVYLRLSDCKYCFFMPPLGQLPTLKHLFIIGLDSVTKVGSEFYANAVKPFQCLESLWFERMSEWSEWITIEQEADNPPFPCLRELQIRRCPKLRESLPQCLSSLKKLTIIDCKKLMVSLPSAPTICELNLAHCDEIMLTELPDELKGLMIRGCNSVLSLLGGLSRSNCLEQLKISDCSSPILFPQGGLVRTLKRLEIRNCKKLELQMLTQYASLQRLSLHYSCDSLKYFMLQLFLKLKQLTFHGCRNLTSLSLPEENQVLTWLNFLEIVLCPNFASFPKGALPAPNLTSLTVSDCVDLKSLPENMDSSLSSLKSLSIYNCPELEYCPENGFPRSLNSLVVSFCDKLIARRGNWGIAKLPSLKLFTIRGKCEGGDCFPDDLLLPSSLSILCIYEIPDMKSLNSRELGNLTGLKQLEIRGCENLQTMVGEDLPSSLSVLKLTNCPLLKEKDSYWHKISHVPFVVIDGVIAL